MVAVAAFDLAPVFRLRAFFGEMALLLTVAAGGIGRILGLVAFFTHMALLTAVPAGIASTSWTILGKVAHWLSLDIDKILTEWQTNPRCTCDTRPLQRSEALYIQLECDPIALFVSAQPKLGKTKGTLLAVATCKPIFPSLSTVASAMTNLITIHTLDLYLVGMLGSLLRASAESMTELWKASQISKVLGR